MKYVIGLSFGLVAILIMYGLNEYVFKKPVSEFLIGWFACLAYQYGKEVYLDYHSKT